MILKTGIQVKNGALSGQKFGAVSLLVDFSGSLIGPCRNMPLRLGQRYFTLHFNG